MTYKRFTTSCLDCKREISSNNFQKHIDSKLCMNPFIRSTEYDDRKSRSNCIKCGKRCFSFSSLTQHEIRCSGTTPSSNRVCEKCGAAFYSKRKRKCCSDACARIKSDAQKKALSDSMKLAVKNNPESYAGGYNRGRVKSFICTNGFKVLGAWEREFVEFCLSNHILVEQPNTGFSYQWNGERTYFPDFYLPETDQWVEIKGLQTERDKSKWDSLRNYHKKNLLVLSGPPSWILTNDRSFMRRLL